MMIVIRSLEMKPICVTRITVDNAGEQESQADETKEEKSHGDEHCLIMVRRRSRRGLEPEMEMQDNPEQFLRCRAHRDKNGNCQG
jgi:hypothetical protein